ncbi:hypothetical protein CIT26_20030 [Mesorhizobium temperatum]|uniref:Uncharacterized protein n=1 Tax=Mesorhizobium temperatum TaxID=241416 RepID=A0A271LHR5_9HYPH|nr:hypothetical protein CIT26_20030 [Mesorhizobium temperatum]
MMTETFETVDPVTDADFAEALTRDPLIAFLTAGADTGGWHPEPQGRVPPCTHLAYGCCASASALSES